jgi:hypothetical protein
MLASWLAGGHVNSEVRMVTDGESPVAVRVGIAVEEVGDDLLIFDTRSQGRECHEASELARIRRPC